MATRQNQTNAEEAKIAEQNDQEATKQAEQNPAEEVNALKKELDELKALLREQMAQMSGKAQTAAEKPARQVEENLGISTDTDAGTEWEEYVEVYVPRHGKGEEKKFYVSVNDRNVLVPADGKYHKLRKPHAEVLMASLEAEAAAEDYADSVPNQAAPASYEQMMNEMDELRRKLKEYGID